jgi:hypothetical protein
MITVNNDKGNKECIQNIGGETFWKTYTWNTNKEMGEQHENRFWGSEVNGTISESYQMAGIGVNVVEPGVLLA